MSYQNESYMFRYRNAYVETENTKVHNSYDDVKDFTSQEDESIEIQGPEAEINEIFDLMKDGEGNITSQ